jgi:hypothetical protein
MYIIAIGWLYVSLMMAITEPSFVAGTLTFLFYGLLPCALFLWLFGTPQRHRNQSAKIAEELAGEPDRPDTEAD